MEAAGFEARCQIIWAKNTFAWGFGRYKFQHEPIFYAHVAGQKDPWYGDKSQSTLWEEKKPGGGYFRLSRFRNTREFFGGWRYLTEALDCFPDPRDGSAAIFKLADRRFARQAVPDVYQPGCGPAGSQLCQRGFVAEAFRIGDGFGLLRRAVKGDVVGFDFNR